MCENFKNFYLVILKFRFSSLNFGNMTSISTISQCVRISMWQHPCWSSSTCSGKCQNFKTLTVKSSSPTSPPASQHDPGAAMHSSAWGWLNKAQQWRRSDRTLSDESQTVKRFLNGFVRWSRLSDWNILHDYTKVKKEKGEVLQLKLNWLHFSHAMMPETKMLQIQSGI